MRPCVTRPGHLKWTTASVAHKRLPPRTGKNLKHYHLPKGGRETGRLSKQSWEELDSGTDEDLAAVVDPAARMQGSSDRKSVV